MLQVRKPLGPKLGFRGSLDPNSLQKIDKVNRTFRWGLISILDRSAVVDTPAHAWLSLPDATSREYQEIQARDQLSSRTLPS